uniref:Acyl_transf_3 domain-containing protein n=1 Tax=Panagrellus redivivus TaxID=6233 RepID=A0A7E4VD16_PANRE
MVVAYFHRSNDQLRTWLYIPLDPAMPKAKRCDLQYWRAFAIFAVLLFHIWTKLFPNGYLGVDIFFVISGFLMAQILGYTENITLQSAVSFYHRRLRRIAPVYLVFSFGYLVVLYFSILPWDFATAVVDSRWASAFASNVQLYLQKQDYFDFADTVRFYAHAWSLAVEVQTYLVLPVIFALWMNTTHKAKYPILAILAIGSYVLQVTTNYFSYINTAARFWQFSAGFLARDFMPLRIHGLIKLILLTAVTVVTFLPVYKIPRLIGSTVPVIGAAILVASPSPDIDEKPIPSLLLIGDISYVLYLIHWPVVAIARYVLEVDSPFEFSWMAGFVIVVVSISLAYVFHNLVEMPLLSLCQARSYATVLLIIIFGVIHTVLPFIGVAYPPIRLDLASRPQAEALYNSARNFYAPLALPYSWSPFDEIAVVHAMNKAQCVPWDLGCANDTRPFPNTRYCQTTRTTSTKNLTAVVIGNSHAVCFSPIMHESKLYKSVTTVGVYSCPLPPEAATYKKCSPGWDLAIKTIEEVRPDIVYFVNMYFGRIYSPIKGNAKDDDIVKNFNNALEHISNFTKHIIMTSPAVIMDDPNVGVTFTRARWNGKYADFKAPDFRHTNLGIRHDRFTCEKCSKLMLPVLFCGKNYCDGMDREVSMPMWRDRTHLNIFGIRKLFPTVEQSTKAVLGLTD